jgi:hypothetical protein
MNEPRVIVDEPMDDEEDENPFQRKVTYINLDNNNQPLKNEQEAMTNVFTRLSQTGKPKGGTSNSLNTS